MFRTYNKFGNKKTEVGGIKFDSKKEANHYCTLKMMMRAQGPDCVVDIELQPRFELIPAFTDRNGKKHRKIEYVADFRVFYADGREEVEDVKGHLTDIYKLKKKMFIFKYPDVIFKEIF